jgi:hypothetical protein
VTLITVLTIAVVMLAAGDVVAGILALRPARVPARSRSERPR